MFNVLLAASLINDIPIPTCHSSGGEQYFGRFVLAPYSFHLFMTDQTVLIEISKSWEVVFIHNSAFDFSSLKCLLCLLVFMMFVH